MEFWLFVIIVVVVMTCGKVVTAAIEAFSRQRELRPGPGTEEVRQLREELERLEGRLNRISEEQRFLTRLLEERPAPPENRKSGEAIQW